MSVRAALSGHPIPPLADRRQTSVVLHEHQRRLIIVGVLPPGTVLKQAELAKLLEVSRTPPREAFRMLREAGLIEADLNRRARVSGFDPEELDTLYAPLASRSSAWASTRLPGDWRPAELGEARRVLNAIEPAAKAADIDGWSALHHRFHAVLVARVG